MHCGVVTPFGALEKTVKLPLDLLSFIRSSNAVLKYQALFQTNLKNPVFIEVDSDLVLSSLCSSDLDEALAAVVKDLSVEIERLHGAAAAPPDVDRIKEILIKAKKAANRDEHKVEVRFIPAESKTKPFKVRLLGYTEQVNKLQKILHHYLDNELTTEEVLTLKRREMVGCFNKVMELIGMKQTEVTVRASYIPNPCVVMSGPKCHLKEARLVLSSALDSLMVDALALDGPGALQYFQNDGKVSKELVESSCQVLIQEQQAPCRSADLLRIPHSTIQQSSFFFVGFHKKKVEDAKKKIKDLYQAHCCTKIFPSHAVKDLNQEDRKSLMKLAEAQGLYVLDSNDGHSGLVVSGLKAGVSQVEQMLNTITPLRREMRVKEEEDLYTRVAWCIMGQNGSWERLPKSSNYNLEKQTVTNMITDLQGSTWLVNLSKMEARGLDSLRTTMLKRLDNIQDFTLPLYWDTMYKDEDFKEVLLFPSSAEYRSVEQDFKRTANRNILKIVRLQNVHLRRVYEVQKKHISDKNKIEGAGEKLLYHGTSQENCQSIKTKGFNRSFSGKNATVYGDGTYFAVSAGYSSSPVYSQPAADGTQSMFVARVLTGVYTQGNHSMKVPPPRDSQRPHDTYDSLVDQMLSPSIFVVFHDNQAYPDYLITFC